MAKKRGKAQYEGDRFKVREEAQRNFSVVFTAEEFFPGDDRQWRCPPLTEGKVWPAYGIWDEAIDEYLAFCTSNQEAELIVFALMQLERSSGDS